MTVQIPAFRLTVARLMAEHRTRLAERIDQELQKKGQNHTDLAVAVRVDPRTAERWVEGKTEPQRRLRKPVADHLGVPIEELWPDLEAAEKALRDQLDRIEANQQLLLAYFGIEPDEEGEPATRFADAFSGRRVSPAKPSRTAAAKTT